jgi:hypothetical protein
MKDEKLVKALRTAFLEGEISESYLRNLLDRNMLHLEEFVAIIEEPLKDNYYEDKNRHFPFR